MAWLIASCATEHETKPPPCDRDGGDRPSDGGDPHDGAAGDGATDASGNQDDDDGGEGDGGDWSDADCSMPEEPVVGISFQPLHVRTDDGQTVALTEVTGVAFLPGEGGVLVWEKAGRLTHYSLKGDELVLLGEVRLANVLSAGDCGLVSVVLDPKWEENHHLFVSHCISFSYSAVVRYTFDGGNYDEVPETASPVIEVGHPDAIKAWHNIGTLGFFDDEEDSMWLLAGEKNLGENAQDVSSELGKVLRIVPRRGEGTSGYDPHPDNPFAGDPELSSGANVYAWGLRSPWRGTLDRDGRLFIGDVGGKFEEINVLREPGQNFGWIDHDGPCKDDCEGITSPVVSWDKSSNHPYIRDDSAAEASTARIGWLGAYYDGGERDRYDGYLDRTVLISDMCLGFVRALEVDADGRATRDEHVGHMVGLSNAAVGPDGFLYATSFGVCSGRSRGTGGGVYRVLPRTEEDPPELPPEQPEHPLLEDPLGPFPQLISDTGLFTDEALKTPVARAFRYEPALPLWSNGSAKERYLVLPEGAKIDNRERDAWDFPPGTLFFKTFAFDTVDEPGVRIETRVIRRTETGYDYHGYMWRDDGSEADLVALQMSRPVAVQLAQDEVVRHEIPNELDCRSCHESNATVVIGFDELRLAAPRSGETEAQLDLLAEAGLLEVAPPEAPERAAVVHEDATTRQVLGYLHGNCAHCHNASPNAMSMLSLEHGAALAGIIDVPTEGSGQVDGIRVLPGDAAGSVLFQAVSRESDDPELTPMPPIGVQRVDAEAVELLRGWIDGLP